MAKKLYLQDKYIVVDYDDGTFDYIPAKDCVFEKTTTGISIQNRVTDVSVGIDDADAGTWDNSAGGGTPYTPATLLDFCIANTANFNSAVTSLEDVPDVPAYSGNSGKHLAVNGTEDGLEWQTPPSGGGGDLLIIRIDGTTPLTFTVLQNDLGLSISAIATGPGTYLFFGGAGNFAESKTKYYLPTPKTPGTPGSFVDLIAGGDDGSGNNFFITTKQLEPGTAAVTELDNMIDGRVVKVEMNL